MKIELDIKAAAIVAVNDMLKGIYEIPNIATTGRKTENVYRSIGFDVADKFDSKVKKIRKNSYDENKMLKITLKYHEAWALEDILRSLFTTEPNHYNRFRINLVIDDLNQKLA